MRLLSAQQSELLFNAYREYRACSHQRALQEVSSNIDDAEIEKLSEQVKVIWLDVLEKHASFESAEHEQ